MRLTIVFIFLAMSLQCVAQETDRTGYRVDIVEFIRSYAKQESKDIVIDPRVKAFVRLFSEQTPDEITKDEFHMVLLTSGFGSYWSERNGKISTIVRRMNPPPVLMTSRCCARVLV